MASTATITGVVGPARAMTAQVLSNVTFFSIDTNNEILDIAYDNGSGPQRRQISIAAAATITITVSGNAYTITIAN